MSIRFYLKLSKGWGWSGQDFHPHLTHFMTTENPKWHGPAASHLTLTGIPEHATDLSGIASMCVTTALTFGKGMGGK